MDGVHLGRNWTVLRGNHDQVFVDFLNAEPYLEPFLPDCGWLSDNMGGSDTLTSYGIDPREAHANWEAALLAVPADHKAFLSTLPYSHETDELFFVHAGIFPGVPLDQQDPEEMIWIREPFLSDRRNHGKLVVHGHTPVSFPQHQGNRVNLDGGAAWGGALHVAVFEGRNSWLLSGAGRKPLLPCNHPEF